MVAGAICAMGAKAAAPAMITGVALFANQNLELPMWLQIKLPGVGEVNMPKMPDMPKMPSLPSLGKGKKQEAIFVDDNPNTAMGMPAPSKPKITVGKKQLTPEMEAAPTFTDPGNAGVVVDISGDAYKKFPVRRMPGKNMSSFLDMAKDL